MTAPNDIPGLNQYWFQFIVIEDDHLVELWAVPCVGNYRIHTMNMYYLSILGDSYGFYLN